MANSRRGIGPNVYKDWIVGSPDRCLFCLHWFPEEPSIARGIKEDLIAQSISEILVGSPRKAALALHRLQAKLEADGWSNLRITRYHNRNYIRGDRPETDAEVADRFRNDRYRVMAAARRKEQQSLKVQREKTELQRLLTKYGNP